MPRGRPKKQIDLEAVRELASEGNTQEEIARALGFARTTFANRKDVTEAYYKGMAEMKLSLRHWQMNVAKGGNVQMLIWLGKNMLGQADNVKNEDNKAVEKLDSLLKEFQDAVKR